ncbi:MAG: GNAT family N-acetyltransferase [Betaproteobacteria bacterium]|nr:MAG: GNAT family N-acetyltransferase [Betaproteobacteria bacterium]
MRTSYAVYQRPAGSPRRAAPIPGFRLFRWSPTLLAAAPVELVHDRNGFRKNWLYHLPAILFRPSKTYAVYMLLRDEMPLCQCILTPASKRFAFMQPDDWQIGLVYTAPEYRGQGIGRIMVEEILRERGESGSYWWLTEDENVPSRRLAESTLFVHVGEAVRRRGLSGVPYFEIGKVA